MIGWCHRDTVRSARQHQQFIDHLAALSASFWGWRDGIGLTSMAQRLRFLAPRTIAPELARPDTAVTLRVAADGRDRLAEGHPGAYARFTSLQEHPEALVDALATTPVTLLQGDWKLGNLGSHTDGRTILLDWAMPGSGPACWDPAWYLALNRQRLPISKEETIASFREAMQRHGVETRGWFDRQLERSVLAMAVTMGWEKALGDEDELAWWLDGAERGLRSLAAMEG